MSSREYIDRITFEKSFRLFGKKVACEVNAVGELAKLFIKSPAHEEDFFLLLYGFLLHAGSIQSIREERARHMGGSRA